LPAPVRSRDREAVLGSPSGRATNLTLLAALLLAFATGVGAVATGSERGRWVVIGHGLAAMLVILLIPWKSRVVRRGLRRARPSRWVSLMLAVLATGTILAGLGYASALVLSVGGVAGMWLHVALALALVPLVLWHLVARWPGLPRPGRRRTDRSRRTLLRTGALATAAAALYGATTAAVELAGRIGSRRRFTGSYEIGSYAPAAMPTTSWLDDRVPAVESRRWRLTVIDAMGRHQLDLAELDRRRVPLRATLDCTSGWYAHQDWSGVPVSALLRDLGEARSLLVRSITGYWVRLPVRDLDRLLLATRVGGEPLSPGHGHPVRLVAPGRRGFWWVKWVDHIELQSTPWWWQPPFPVT
jgi:DMSO/TMAO reductase YedYZ molybdopterin-dependent catalytic subunit